MKLLFVSLGCDKNLVDTEFMLGMLRDDGIEITNDETEADIIIVNTCCFINDAKEESVNTILEMAEYKKTGPLKALIVTGCLAQRYKEEIKTEIPEVDAILGTNSYEDIVKAVHEALGGTFYENFKTLEGLPSIHTKRSVTTGGHFAYLKIAEGCNKRCTYCIIPYARGRVRSRKIAHVMDEVHALAAKGYKEVVLTGIHLSSYGIEHMEGNPVSQGDWNHRELLALIREVHEIEGLERIRLGSLEPRIITEEFAKSLAELPKFCPHFHLSLQSGCDSVLKRMNRHYTTEDYLRRCEILRKYFKRPAITTDVIVGFPGETEEEFDITEKYLEKVHFYEMHVFKYSRRAGTKAAAMPDQIPEQIKGVRSDRLLALEQKMSEEFRKGFIGEKVSVLFEEMITVDGKEYLVGHTPEYVKAALPKDECEKMRAASGVILEAEAKDLLSSDILLLKNTIAE